MDVYTVRNPRQRRQDARCDAIGDD